MSKYEQADRICPGDLTLTESMMGYDVMLGSHTIGSIEGTPGEIQYLIIKDHLTGNGAGRSALQSFVELSRKSGASEVTTNNAVHDAMEHILKTEGFEQRSDSCGWVKEI
jgi:hypothetical protein